MRKGVTYHVSLVEVSQNRRSHNFQLIAPREELCSIAKGQLFSQPNRRSKKMGRRSRGFSIDTCARSTLSLRRCSTLGIRADGNQARGLAAAYASNIDGLHMLESITSIARTYYPASRRLSISKRISRATGDGTWIDQTRLTDRRRTANGNSEDR